jgi:hypothetical protein
MAAGTGRFKRRSLSHRSRGNQKSSHARFREEVSEKVSEELGEKVREKVSERVRE